MLSTILLFAVLWMAMFEGEQEIYQIGEQVEDFTLKGVDEAWVSLSDYLGEQGVILVFTCNTCPYAQLYEDRLIALHQEFAPTGFPVLAVNPNDAGMKPGDSFEKMKERAAEKEFPYPYLVDTKQEVFPKYGATRTPEIFLLDRDRVLRYTGAIDDNPQDPTAVSTRYVAEAITAMMAGKSPQPAKTKAIGCGIKMKKSAG